MNKIVKHLSFLFLVIFVLLSTIVISNLGVNATETKSNQSQTRTDAWIEQLQANFNNPQWFYDNLNAQDRLNIRLALDYAIPRTQIINSILNGFGTTLATTDLPQTGVYFDSNLEARSSNLNLASQLLSKVFGYTYYLSDNSNTPYSEDAQYFKMQLIVSNADPFLGQAASRFQYYLGTLGIQCLISLLTPSQIKERIFNNIAGIGYNSAQGGTDGLFMDWTGNIIPDDGSFFYSSNKMPYGNYQFVNDSNINNLINIEQNDHNQINRIQAYHDLQQYLSDEAVRNILYQKLDTYVMNPNLTGFNSFYTYQKDIPFQNMSFSNNKTTIVIALPGKIENLNPLLLNSTYDNYLLKQLWAGGLLTIADPPNDSTHNNYSIYKNLASWYNVSANGLDYFFNLKTGLKFQDNTSINTTDVKFSYLSAMNPVLNSSYGPTLNNQLSNTNSIIIHNSTLIEFKLTKWDPFSLLKLFTLTIIPSHIYSQIPVESWSVNPTNTGSNSTGAVQIVGSGPYQFSKYKDGNGTLLAWSGWNNSYNAQFSDVPYSSVPSINNITIITINKLDDVVTALMNGKIDYADTNYNFSTVFNEIKGPSLQIVNASSLTWAELGLNQASPIWGLSPINPAGMTCYGCVYPTIQRQTTQGMITSTYSSQSPSSINFLLIAFLVILIIGFAVYGITNKYGSKIPDNRQKLQLNQHNGVRSFNIPRFCQYCGNRVQKNDLFCENCGNRL